MSDPVVTVTPPETIGLEIQNSAGVTQTSVQAPTTINITIGEARPGGDLPALENNPALPEDFLVTYDGLNRLTVGPGGGLYVSPQIMTPEDFGAKEINISNASQKLGLQKFFDAASLRKNTGKLFLIPEGRYRCDETLILATPAAEIKANGWIYTPNNLRITAIRYFGSNRDATAYRCRVSLRVQKELTLGVASWGSYAYADEWLCTDAERTKYLVEDDCGVEIAGTCWNDSIEVWSWNYCITIRALAANYESRNYGAIQNMQLHVRDLRGFKVGVLLGAYGTDMWCAANNIWIESQSGSSNNIPNKARYHVAMTWVSPSGGTNSVDTNHFFGGELDNMKINLHPSINGSPWLLDRCRNNHLGRFRLEGNTLESPPGVFTMYDSRPYDCINPISSECYGNSGTYLRTTPMRAPRNNGLANRILGREAQPWGQVSDIPKVMAEVDFDRAFSNGPDEIMLPPYVVASAHTVGSFNTFRNYVKTNGLDVGSYTVGYGYLGPEPTRRKLWAQFQHVGVLFAMDGPQVQNPYNRIIVELFQEELASPPNVFVRGYDAAKNLLATHPANQPSDRFVRLHISQHTDFGESSGSYFAPIQQELSFSVMEGKNVKYLFVGIGGGYPFPSFRILTENILLTPLEINRARNASHLPSSGRYSVGMEVFNVNVNYLCTTAGHAITGEWATGVAVKANQWYRHAGRTYLATIGGTTGNNPPIHTDTSEPTDKGTSPNSGVTWRYVDVTEGPAVFTQVSGLPATITGGNAMGT